MLYPIRFTVCSYNLWNDQRWPDRQEPLKQFLQRHLPDILCIQELRPVTCDFVDAVLQDHQRVEDPFAGWQQEGNIYWNEEMFELVEHGAEDIGILEELRRLFWVRLRFRGTAKAPTLFVSTAHYTWPGHAAELKDGANVRIPQARKTVEVLNALVPPDEALLFMGDLNDYGHPIHILRQGGLTDSFAALGRHASPTWPAVPIAQGPPSPLDWIFHRGPIRPMTCDIVDFYVADLPPSDHKPIMATYRYLNER
jgi:endonuclease/exonuclease/phosphatase (EEP) superfamily protein YafD